LFRSKKPVETNLIFSLNLLGAFLCVLHEQVVTVFEVAADVRTSDVAMPTHLGVLGAQVAAE